MNVGKYFKALADETRLRLLNLFLHHELNVNEVVEILRMGQPRISRHLKILADSGLLCSRRNGLWTFYSVVTEGDGHQFIQNIKYLFQQDDQFVADLGRARQVVEERSLATTRFFDSIAEDWEGLKQEIIGHFDLSSLILKNIPQDQVVVDLGCGTGDLLLGLAKKSRLTIGVEKAPRMLDQARRRILAEGVDVDLRIGAIEHLPLRDEEADVAVINMVLHHLASPVNAIAEVGRILRPEGLFILVDLLKHQLESMRGRFGDRWLGFSREEITEWLELNGFTYDSMAFFDLKHGLQGFNIVAVKGNNA